MGQLNNIFKMMFILKRGNKIKIKELAEEIEVTERQIRRYKEVLDEYFDIESTQGPDGGYRLKQQYFPFKELLTENEIAALRMSINSINDTFIEKDISLEKAIDKINFSIINRDEELISNEQIIPYSSPKSANGYIIRMHDDIYECILNGYEVYIKYCDNNGRITERRVQPHKYLRYKAEYYLVATCLLRNELRYFKLTRIKEYKVTKDKFKKDENISIVLEEHRKNSIGIFGGEEYNVELLIKPPMANSIKERIWVENQEVIELEQGKIIFKATMKGGPELISWILSMGDSVNIISPDTLKQKVKEKLENMIKNI